MDEENIVIDVKKTNNNKGKKKTNKQSNKKNKAKQEKKQKRIKRLKKFALIFIFIIAIVLLLSSSLFNINTISVEGNDKLSEERVISLSEIELYTNMFEFSKLRAENKISENPYVEHVKISRKIPSTILISINERIPTYMLQFADSYVYINNQGYMLEISNEKIEVPILTGFTTDLSNIKAGNRINEDDLKKMGMVIKIYQTLSNNGISENLSKIDMSNEKNYAIFYDNEGKKVYLGNGSDLSTKVVLLKSILESSSEKSGEIFLNVDLNTERAYFRESIQ